MCPESVGRKKLPLQARGGDRNYHTIFSAARADAALFPVGGVTNLKRIGGLHYGSKNIPKNRQHTTLREFQF